MKIRKLFSRLGERLQNWSRRYDLDMTIARKLTDEDCDSLQFVTEHPAWEVLKLVRDNMNAERNKSAIAFCDGRSFVLFKKMEGLNDYIDTIEEIVNLHKKKTQPAVEPQERPRKISEYVPR